MRASSRNRSRTTSLKMCPSHDNRDFFEGLALECLCQTYTAAKTLEEARVLVRTLSLRSGDCVLDVACGAGRLSHALAGMGPTLTGVDRVPQLVAQARSKGGARATFECVDVREMSHVSVFDAAFCVGTSFGYSDDAGNLAFLSAIARALKPMGRFLLQTTLASEIVFRSPPSTAWAQHGDVHMLRTMSYQHQSGRLVTQYRFLRETEQEDRTADFRVYSSRDLAEMCASVGLLPTSLMNKTCDAPFGFDSTHLSLLARRDAHLR